MIIFCQHKIPSRVTPTGFGMGGQGSDWRVNRKKFGGVSNKQKMCIKLGKNRNCVLYLVKYRQSVLSVKRGVCKDIKLREACRKLGNIGGP